MSNRIEEGCLAVVVAGRFSDNIGKVVRVGKFVGNLSDSRLKDYWQVDKPMTFITYNNVIVDERYFQRECNLMRIDDLPEEHKVIEKELELNLV